MPTWIRQARARTLSTAIRKGHRRSPIGVGVAGCPPYLHPAGLHELPAAGLQQGPQGAGLQGPGLIPRAAVSLQRFAVAAACIFRTAGSSSAITSPAPKRSSRAASFGARATRSRSGPEAYPPPGARASICYQTCSGTRAAASGSLSSQPMSKPEL
jgi:hypothetical protein